MWHCREPFETERTKSAISKVVVKVGCLRALAIIVAVSPCHDENKLTDHGVVDWGLAERFCGT